jgi:hypothetical protein
MGKKHPLELLGIVVGLLHRVVRDLVVLVIASEEFRKLQHAAKKSADWAAR